MNDRPDAAELLEAVRRFIETEVIPDSSGPRKYQARVAANVCLFVCGLFKLLALLTTIASAVAEIGIWLISLGLQHLFEPRKGSFNNPSFSNYTKIICDLFCTHSFFYMLSVAYDGHIAFIE